MNADDIAGLNAYIDKLASLTGKNIKLRHLFNSFKIPS
jgi:hypothetical protein